MRSKKSRAKKPLSEKDLKLGEKYDRKTAALSYAKRGLSVIPVGQDKKPIFPWKEYTQRIATEKEIEKWWKENPNAGVAIITGKISNLTVIDIEKGGITKYLPQTMIIKTGGGGYHYYYRYTDKFKNSVRIRELTDIRNDNGYVIAPPSRHKSGKRYLYHKGNEITEFPHHLFLSESLKARKKNDWDELSTQPIEKGKRNETAAKFAGLFLTQTPYKYWEQIAWPALMNWNTTKCQPPLENSELRAVYESISDRVTYKQDDTEKEVHSVTDLITNYETKIRDLRSGKPLGIPTGFTTLDTCLNGGWKAGDLILVGARPSVGKTSLALSFAVNAAKAGKKVLFFSIEMSALDIFEKLLSFVTGLNYTDIITGKIPTEKLDQGIKKAAAYGISVAELSRATSTEVIEVVKQQLLEQEIDLIIVDYLQFLRDKSKSGNDSVRVGQISKNLKTLARMTQIPVIAPTQLNRKPEHRNGEPTLSDLRDSGELEQDADVVIMLKRDPNGVTKDDAKLIVAKNRKGQTGNVNIGFDLATTMFYER